MSLFLKVLILSIVIVLAVYLPRFLRGEKLSHNIRVELIGISVVILMLTIILYAADNSVMGFP